MVYEQRQFAFPDGKTKAVVLSFDDGLVQDRRLVEVFERHGLKGTFHLVSDFLGTEDDWLIEFTGEPARYLEAGEIADLFAGHEVSSHSLSHPALTTVNDAEVLRQVNQDRARLATLSGQSVDSHAYPFGAHDDRVVSLLVGTDLKAARVVEGTGSFDLPDDPLRWAPTAHHLEAEAHIERFLKESDGRPRLLLIYGHSWEFDIGEDGNDWTLIERISASLGSREDLWSAGLGEVARYLEAIRSLEQLDGDIWNRSDQPVWLRVHGKILKLDPGERLSQSRIGRSP